MIAHHEVTSDMPGLLLFPLITRHHSCIPAVSLLAPFQAAAPKCLLTASLHHCCSGSTATTLLHSAQLQPPQQAHTCALALQPPLGPQWPL